MKRLLVVMFLMIGLMAGTQTFGRGSSADDCPPGSTDPDCKK